MKAISYFFLLTVSNLLFSQSIDDSFSQRKMQKDLEIFKEIRLKANSGLYKYRTKDQIDSIYSWAEMEIQNSSTYLDFYNIISQLTDFEGSLHNDTYFPDQYSKNIHHEENGYFPYPLKWISGKWRINYDKGEIPLGAEMVSINGIPISEVIKNLYKFYTTDGYNTTGKRIGLRAHFPIYFRYQYDRKNNFVIEYRLENSDTVHTKTIESTGYSEYYRNFRDRHSKPIDQNYYSNNKPKYHYEQINSSTGILTIPSFSMGNERSNEHKKYKAFLDSIFTNFKAKKIQNLIVDVRLNGGGTDPNDVLTYSYLTNRNFTESKEVWISFFKVPYVRYYNSSIPKFLRPLGIGKYNRMFQKRFPIDKDGKYFMGKNESELQVRHPNEKAFQGQIYLLISPAVASAGSLFASMVAGNENTMVIGEETMGGYYGHNGHTNMEYKLPKSKIVTSFSIENIEQDVPVKANQIYGRGLIPDYEVSQTYSDFLDNEDTQMNFVLELIQKNN